MFGLGENYLSALGVFLGYSALQISILSSLPQLVGAFIQLASNSMAKLFRSMKRLVVFLSVLQSLLWIALIFIIFNTNNYELILLWSVIYYATACAMGPVWISWIGYLVPRSIRSNYHANRNRIINSLIFISILIGGAILEIFESNMVLAFSIMFGVASVGRMLSAYYLNKKDDAGNTDDGDAYSYKNILKSKNKITIYSLQYIYSLFSNVSRAFIYYIHTSNNGSWVFCFNAVNGCMVDRKYFKFKILG